MITAMLVAACGHGEDTGDFSSFGELEDTASTGEPAGTEHAGEDEGDKPDEPNDDRPDADSGEPPCGSSTKECDGDGGDDHDDPTSRPDDGGNGEADGGEVSCCDEQRTECTDAGTSVTTCDGLEAICTSEDCTDLLTVCPLEGIPMPMACARMYTACWSFRPNKCQREGYNSCMNALDDDALCTAWDAECTAREDYCTDLLADYDEHGLQYHCTDWGHDFDPCWLEFLACAADEATCIDELVCCAGDNNGYYEQCFNGADGDDPPDEGGAEDGPSP